MATNLVATGKTTAKVAKFVRWTMSESDGSSVTGRCSLDDYIACNAETLSADDVRGLRALSGKRKMTFGGGAAPLVTVVASLPRPAPRASDLLGGTGSGRVAAREDARMTYTVTLDAGCYAEGWATMLEARLHLIAAQAEGRHGYITDDAGQDIRIGDAAWRAYSAGVDWADREWEAHPDPVASGAWRSSAIDALPLVDADSDHDDRDALAYIANEAARERWNAMIAEAS